MSGKALHRLFGPELVWGAQLPQNRVGLGLSCTSQCRWAPGLHGEMFGGISALSCASGLCVRRGTGWGVLLHLPPGWSWAVASLGIAFTFSFHWRLKLSVMAYRFSLDSVNT